MSCCKVEYSISDAFDRHLEALETFVSVSTQQPARVADGAKHILESLKIESDFWLRINQIDKAWSVYPQRIHTELGLAQNSFLIHFPVF